MLQDLTHHNEALHREIEEQQRNHPKPENSRDGCRDGEDFGAGARTLHDGEDSLSVQAAELRTALAEAYEELSRWQQERRGALAAAEQGLTLLKVLSNSSKVEEMAALLKVSDCLMAVGKGKTAVMRGQEAAQQCSETGDVWAGVMALQARSARASTTHDWELCVCCQFCTLALFGTELTRGSAFRRCVG
ncbi:unnamed protein product [Symbiodinium sp. CCMP2456]|nr:unnamed protein product [Symbiodinium sp. CCMP2456]